MIVGKFSALKGFGLMLLLVISMISFIGGILCGDAIVIACCSILLLLNIGVSLFLFSYWSGTRFTEGSKVIIKISLKKN